MTSLFFALGIFFILYEVNVFINPKKDLDFLSRIRKKKDYFTSQETREDEKTKGCIYAFYNIGYFLWSLIGLFVATQWRMFAILFIIGLISALLFKVYDKLNISGGVLHILNKRIDSLACVLVMVEITLVHFHDFSLFKLCSDVLF